MNHKSNWAARVALLLIATATTLASTSVFASEIRFTFGEYSDKTGPFWQKVAADFMAENPGVTIKAEPVPWNEYLQRLTTDISAGTQPDMSVLASIWLADFAGQGLIEPARNVITPEVEAAFVPALMGPSIVGDELVGIPFAASARAMMINTDLYEKAGATAPKTWEELADASRKISAGGNVGFGLPGTGQEVDVYFYYALWSFGGDILKADGTSGLDSPEAIEAAKFYEAMVKDKLTQPEPTGSTREDVFAQFKQGKVGAIFTFPMLVPQIRSENPELKFQVLPFPVKTAAAAMAVTDSLAVFKASPNKEDIKKFITFMFQDKYQAEFAQIDGLLPVTTSVIASQTDQDIKGFADGLNVARFQPMVKNWDAAGDATMRALQSIYLGNASAEDAMNTAAAEVNAILAGN